MQRRIGGAFGRLWRGYGALWRELKGWRLFVFYAMHYTLLFAGMRRLVFCAFAAQDRSFVWGTDGSAQYFSFLTYLSKTVREGLRALLSGEGWRFPLYDFRQALVAQNTQYGLPEALAILWPPDRVEDFYRLYVLGNYYFAGLSFSLFGFYWKQRPLPVLAGAVSYAFCGFALFAGVTHPQYMIPMVLLPLLLVGTERVLRKERSFLLTFSVFFSMIAHFGVYFSCMQAAFVALYACLRFFDLYETDRPRQFALLWGRLCAWGGTGILLSGFTAIPTLLVIADTGRVGSSALAAAHPLHYGASYYIKFLLRFIAHSGDVGSWTWLGFAAPALPAVLLLFVRRRREERALRVGFAVLTAMLMIPAAAYAMSGFNNIVNRFCFGYAFAVAAILMFMLPHLAAPTKREAALLAGGLALYAAACRLLGEGIDHHSAAMAAALLLAALLALFAWDARGRTARLRMPALLLLALGSVAYSAYVKYDLEWFLAEFKNHAFYSMQTGQYGDLGRSETVGGDGGFFRVSGDSIGRDERNFAFYYDLNGLTAYPYYGNSQSFLQWMREMEVARRDVNHSITELDNRFAMLTLANVKYYAAKRPQAYWPYGFEATGESSGDSAILRNAAWLPIGYTYSAYVSRERYERLSALGKQEAQLQAVVLDEAPDSPAIGEADIAPTARQLPVELVGTDALAWDGKSLAVGEAGATMTLAFEALPGTETYLRIVGLDLRDEATDGNVKVSVSDGTAQWQAAFSSDAYVHANRQHTQMLDLGWNRSGRTEITLTFPRAGAFGLEDVEVWYQPMDGYLAQAAKLGEETLQNVVTSGSGLTGEIAVSTDKFLCIALPYLDGWTAYVDGARVPLCRANTAFMGVELTAGSHSVELRYRLPGLTAGLLLSAGGMLCLAALIASGRRRARDRSISPSISKRI